MKLRIAGLVVIGLVVGLASPQADILEQVLVKVNGEIITKTDLEARQIAALRQKQPNLRPDSDAELQKALAEITPEVIVDAVEELLMVQRGKELGYTMSTEQFTGIVENIKKENKIESDAALEAALKQEGMTMADLRRQLERTMLVQRVQQTDIMAKLQVTDTELRAYYETHKDEFATTPQITLREITIAVPVTAQGINVAQDDAAKEKAEDVRKKAAAGEPFARLAADFSDSGSKANGGLVGPLSKSDLSEELQKAVAGLKTGCAGRSPAPPECRRRRSAVFRGTRSRLTEEFSCPRKTVAVPFMVRKNQRVLYVSTSTRRARREKVSRARSSDGAGMPAPPAPFMAGWVVLRFALGIR